MRVFITDQSQQKVQETIESTDTELAGVEALSRHIYFVQVHT